MKASYGVDTSKFRNSKNVWSQDAMLRDMTRFTMTKKDTEEVNAILVMLAGFLIKFLVVPYVLSRLTKTLLNLLKRLIILLYEKAKSLVIPRPTLRS